MAKHTEYELEELFNEFLDECVESMDIFGMKYWPSTVLKECDPIAYNVTMSDWLDGLDDCDECDLNPAECTCD